MAPADISGQVALVTGASRGIGRVIACRLAEAGAAVALVARSADGLDETRAMIEDQGGRGWTAALDVTDRAAVDRAVERATADLGPIDLLVNNAGVNGPTGPSWEVDPDEWWRTVEINLRGYFLFQRAVLPGMLSRRAGRIIDIASNAGVHRWPWVTAYAVSKSAVIKLVENFAAEVRKDGIAIFAFHPGLVTIGLTSRLFEVDRAKIEPGSIQDRIFSWFERKIDAGETVPPGPVAEFVLALASGRYDALSGRYLTIDDDLDALLARMEEIQRDDLLTLRLRA